MQFIENSTQREGARGIQSPARTPVSSITHDLPKAIAIVGPTASGKSALALELARRIGGEIISCDSMQVYIGMDIGTAKPTPEERAEIPHHMVDIITPAQEFSCADYRSLASAAVDDITARKKLPIFCGGTGLYLDSVLEAERFSPDIDPALHEELLKQNPGELYAKLSECDPESAALTHQNNVRRVIRALEIFLGTGVTKSEWDRRSKLAGKRINALKIGLDFRDRALLYKRIDARVDEMIASGLAAEVAALPRPLCKTASQAIGYSEFLKYGTDDLPFVINQIKQDTRNYAKRQLTWFRRDPEINWFFIDDSPDLRVNFKNIVNNSLELLRTAF
jgi:tRNA dimethylallyltransferase